jgi:hypothetical protein
VSPRPDLKLIAGNDGEVESLPGLIPEGDYELKLEDWETSCLYGGRSQKLTLWFAVMQFGEYFKVRVPRYYNVKLMGPPRHKGRFKAPFCGDFAREYAELLSPPRRLDRFNLAELARHIVVGKVETVVRSAKQKRLPEACRYSVVRELLRLHI